MNKFQKKIPTHLFIFLVLITWTVSAERNFCCPNGAPISYRRCLDGERTWAKHCTSGAYILPEEEYELTNDDTITITTTQKKIEIEKDRYCLGSIQNETDKVAVICFSSIIEPATELNNNPYLHAVQICCAISISFLSLTIIVYILLPKLRDLQGKCIMIIITNLLFAYTVLFVLQTPTPRGYTSCLVLAASNYFWFLSAFFWINVVAINIWRTTMKPQFLLNNRYIFLFYNIYGWGCPLIFLTAALISHHIKGDHIKPGWTEYSCWFTGFAQLIYFHIPIFILMSMNIVIYISVGWKIWKNGRRNLGSEQSTNIRIHNSRKYKCMLYLKLFLIMGLTWIFEPLSYILEHDFLLWLIIDYINALQGIILFLLLVVFRKRVRRELARRGGIIFGKLPKDWALIPDEEIEELDESVDEEEPINEFNVQLNQPF